jgi:hypothetical protein
MQNFANKYDARTIWLFAIGSVALGIAAAFATQGLGPKVTSAVYAGIVGVAGFASTFATKARVRGAVGAFLFAALLAAIGYYAVVSYVFSTVTSQATDLMSNGQAHEAGVQAGTFFGRFFGAFAAIVAFLETSIVGIAGAVAGSRAKSGFAPRAAMA